MASAIPLDGSRQALPLYDLFLDLPHPAAAAGCPPPFVLGGLTSSPEMEGELSANMSRIAAFAFPEYDDAVSQRIPRDKALNRFSQYAMQPKSFQNYTFSMQLQSGVRIHGFVRRYLPVHPVVKHRYDVGRRGERALVILTRYSGGDLVYAAILKTMDAISFQQAALDGKNPHPEPQKWFLHRLFDEHRKLCGAFASLPLHKKVPMTLTVEFGEIGNKNLAQLDKVDTTKFMIPTCLLASTPVVEALTSSSILPLLRVLGVSSTLRLVSALLSENRVLLLSASPTRLAQCARSALSILAQGLLNWQHLYIPVLPPHLFQYLAAPVPYLIGMLTSLLPKMDQTPADGLGEIVIINLDTCQMETRGMNAADVPTKVPDLFRNSTYEHGMPAATISAAEMLAQDLIEVLKVDKRALYGESALTNVSETAAKATRAVKSGITTLARKGKNFFNNRIGSSLTDSSNNSGTDEETMDSGGATEEGSGTPQNTIAPDFIYIQGSQNESVEEEARIAFTSFFLALFGNMRWYLTAYPGKLPELDRQRFLQQKRAMGEGEHTPIWPLLQNFCHTQMLEQFAKARVEEVRLRVPVTSDSPLFTQCANVHVLENRDFSVVNVKNVCRQVAQNTPSRHIVQTSARRTAMLLTSNRSYDGDYTYAVSQLVEQCRESTSVLFDVMSVIWVRLRDSKGLHWKHGLQALQILRNLLHNGPLAAIAEATDGLDKIRAMKYYNDNMRSQICTQIRQAASQVYTLLVDRAKLYNIRRLCLNKRRRQPGPYTRDSRLQVTIPFKRMHDALNPKVNTRVAPAPPATQPTSSSATLSTNEDLFGLANVDVAPVGSAPGSGNAPVPNDLMGLFGSVSISDPGQPPARDQVTTAPSGGFDPFAPSHPPKMPDAQQPSTPMPQMQALQPSFASPQPQPPSPYGVGQQHQLLPSQNSFGAPPQQYQQPPQFQQQPPLPGQHPPAQTTAYPGTPQGAFGGPPTPQQQYFQQHQAPPGGHPHYPPQQQQQHHPSYHQQQPSPYYPPQQPYQQQPPPQAQPPKPNISQFDPFK